MTWFEGSPLCIMSTLLTTSNLIKFVLKLDSLFNIFHQKLAAKRPFFRILCPKRYTTCVNSFRRIMGNWVPLQNVWVQSLKERGLQPKMRGSIFGLQVQMQTFNCWLRRTMSQERLNHLNYCQFIKLKLTS